jgi:hypothetical protein
MRRLLLLLLLSAASLQAGPPPVTIRVHAEASASDGDSFVTPIKLQNPPKDVKIRKLPIMSEKDIVSFYPFAAQDGSIGAYFQLDAHGTNKLSQHSVEYRDSLVVALVNGRVSATMITGKKITDGILYIPYGFSPQEIVQLQTQFPIIGKEKEFSAQKKKAYDALKQHKKNQQQAAKAEAASQKP